MTSLRDRARALKRETMTLWFALRDARTPRAAKWLAALVVAYALSPIDLIPDFIPVLGYLDDVILLPLGIALCLKLIPAEVLADARLQAQAGLDRPVNFVAAALIVVIWTSLSALAGFWLWKIFVS